MDNFVTRHQLDENRSGNKLSYFYCESTVLLL